jgi:hypothetical protein
LKKQYENRRNKQTKEDRADQKLQDNRKTELMSLEKERYLFIKELPKNVRMRLRNFFSETIDKQIELIINLSGKYIDEEQRMEMKKEAETELLKPIEETIINGYNAVIKLGGEYQQKKNIDYLPAKELFYSTTDSLFKSLNVFSNS